MKFTTDAKMALFTSSTATLLTTPGFSEISGQELAKIAQNPVGNPVSVPFITANCKVESSQRRAVPVGVACPLA